jgi:hypothetical protein
MANHYQSAIASDILLHERTLPASFKKVITNGNSKPRVLIIIGNLASGGKERRLIEMLTYFRKNKQFEFLVVLGNDEIHYKSFHDLG